jgi:RimJ/RimL family protein N-acetyltransferase
MRPLSLPRPVPELSGGMVRLSAADPVADAVGYHALYADARIRSHVGDPPLATVAEAEAELRRLIAIPTISLWLIRDRVDGTIVGRYFLDRSQAADGIVVGEGVRVAPGRWRTGVHRDARRSMLQYAFVELAAVRFVTRARIGNDNMIRAAIAFGFLRGPDEEHTGYRYACFTLSAERWRSTSR